MGVLNAFSSRIDGKRSDVAPPVYALHGLHLRSEIPLCAPLSEGALPEGTLPDLDVSWGGRTRVPARPPAGRLLASQSNRLGFGYAVVETEAGWTARFYGRAEFRYHERERMMRVHLAPGVDPALAPILLDGNVLTFLLVLSGEAPLHASAVEVSGSGLAFVGHSGNGKSTLAALLCANGARLITDDLLRLDGTGEALRCLPGSGQIRLRPNAAPLAQELPDASAAMTVDQRLAVRPASGSQSRPPLRAIVIPHPSRECSVVSVERLDAPAALHRLSNFPRASGWIEREPLRRQFQLYARIAREVPVYEAVIPWGPPFRDGVAAALIENVGVAPAPGGEHG